MQAEVSKPIETVAVIKIVKGAAYNERRLRLQPEPPNEFCIVLTGA